jgi:hypothetical protein
MGVRLLCLINEGLAWYLQAGKTGCNVTRLAFTNKCMAHSTENIDIFVSGIKQNSHWFEHIRLFWNRIPQLLFPWILLVIADSIPTKEYWHSYLRMVFHLVWHIIKNRFSYVFIQFLKSISVGAASLKIKKILSPISSYFGHFPFLVNPHAHNETLLKFEWTLSVMNNVGTSLRKRRHY